MTDLLAYISNLTREYPGIASVWLFGSRSNGNARPDSDWDLFAFANPEVFARLRADHGRRHRDIDLLVVIDGTEFEAPWGVKPKRGWLSEWEWKELSTTEASYTAPSRENTGSEWNHPLQLLKAIRIWPNQE